MGDWDIIWLVPSLSLKEDGGYILEQGHWEVLTLESSNEKLLAARTIQRNEFETILRNKLIPAP